MANDNPKVTLLRKATCVHTVIFGKLRCRFTGGVPTTVRPAIALFLKNQKKEDGSALFKVTGLPPIVKPAKQAIAPMDKANIEKPVKAVLVNTTNSLKETGIKTQPRPNVLGNILAQRTLIECIN